MDEEQALISQLESQPDSLKLLTKLAKNCYIRGVYRAAESLLRRTLQLNGSNAIVLANMGYFLLQTGEETEAEAILQRAVQEDARYLSTTPPLPLTFCPSILSSSHHGVRAAAASPGATSPSSSSRAGSASAANALPPAMPRRPTTTPRASAAAALRISSAPRCEPTLGAHAVCVCVCVRAR